MKPFSSLYKKDLKFKLIAFKQTNYLNKVMLISFKFNNKRAKIIGSEISFSIFLYKRLTKALKNRYTRVTRGNTTLYSLSLFSTRT